jgi:hypothetical protein
LEFEVFVVHLDGVVFWQGVPKAVVYFKGGHSIVAKKDGDNADDGQYKQAIT